jgi:hypothetical protein
VVDTRFDLLPPAMGFAGEEWFHENDNHGPHFTCVNNGVRVCVWVDTNPEGEWHLQLATPRYDVEFSWTGRVEPALVDVPIGEPIHDLTSGGNNEE